MNLSAVRTILLKTAHQLCFHLIQIPPTLSAVDRVLDISSGPLLRLVLVHVGGGSEGQQRFTQRSQRVLLHISQTSRALWRCQTHLKHAVLPFSDHPHSDTDLLDLVVLFILIFLILDILLVLVLLA